MRQARWKGAVRIAPLVLLMLAASSAARAQKNQPDEDIDTPGLTIEAIAGWDGTVDRRVPVPVSFLIRNDSEQIIEGQIRLSNPWGGETVTLGEVVVAPGTSRRFASIRDMTDWYVCFATLQDGERVLWRRELAVATGSEFDPLVNFALFIDEGGRRLQFAGPTRGAASAAATNQMIAGETGYSIRSLTVEPWQVPDHPGPLVPARAIVFPEGAAADELNYMQWRAVAEWLCQGGAVFVHDDSPEIVAQLTEASPLDVDPPVSSGGFLVHRAGLGAIHEYSQPLLTAGQNESRQRIGETIATMTGSHVSALVDAVYPYNARGGRADLNRVLLVAFFGCYTFLSGVVAMLLFRMTRQRVAVYTVVIVAGASILSALLGGYLRFSRGDLRWVTVTQPGAGGAVQVGKIDVQSAGGRNTHVAIHGEQADLQLIGGNGRFYPWATSGPSYPPYTWQPNLSTGVEDTWQINVPITPWGRRRCIATAFSNQLQRLDFELDFAPAPRPGQNEPAAGVVPGEFSLKLANHLLFDITECWLVIGVTGRYPNQAGGSQSQYGIFQYQGNTPAPGALTDVYQTYHLQELSPGETLEDSFPATFQIMRNDWERAVQLTQTSLIPPRISHLGAASAWIVGVVEESPVMTIDDERSDFVPQEHLHILIQEIRPEDMPDVSLFTAGDGVD